MSALRKNRYAPKTQIQDVPYFVPKSTAGGGFRWNSPERKKTPKRLFRGSQCPMDICGSNFGAGNETRTRDPDLGKVVLYQLSYSRVLVVRIL